MNSTQFDHAHLGLDDGNVMSSVLTFDQKTFDLVVRAALFIFDRGFSFERNCVLRRWESETLK